MAVNPVYIDFAVRNVKQVQAAIKSVSDAVIAAESRAARAPAQPAGGRSRAAAERVRAEEGAERAIATTRRSSARDADRTASDAVRQARVAATERIRIAQRVAAEERRLRTEIARESGRARPARATDANARLAVLRASKNGAPHEQQVALGKVGDMRIADVAAKAEGAAARRAAQEKIAAHKVADREEAKGRAAGVAEFEKAERAKNREAAKWVREREREARKEHAETVAQRMRLAKAIVGGGAQAVKHAVRGGTALARTALNLGGGFDIQDALHEKMSLEREAISLSNSAFQGKPGEKRLSAEEVQARAKESARVTGTDASELLRGAASYGAKTGEYKGGLDLQEFFGKVAKGTGASVSDIASTAGILRVQNKNLNPEEMKQLILSTVRQGQAGSVEFADLAKVAGKVTKSASSYAGDQATTQGKLLGLAQVAVRTSGSPEEAATVVSNLSADASKHAKAIEKTLGKGTFNEKGQIAKAPEEFLADVMEKTGGNLQKVQALGFGQRSMKMFAALSPTFNEAESEALKKNPKDKEGARKAGRAAVLADMSEMTNATMTMKDLESNVAETMKGSAEQFEAAVRDLKTMVGDELLPVMKDMIPVIKDAVPPFKDLLRSLVAMARWAEQNPLAAALLGLGGMILKTVAAEFATAKLGEFIKSLLSGGGAGGIPGVGGGGAAGLGTVGKAVAVVGAGVVAGEMTKEWVDSGFADEKNKDDARRARQIEALNLTSAARHGSLTPEQKKRAAELTQQLAKDKEAMAAEMDPDNASTVKKVTGAFGAALGGIQGAVTGTDSFAEVQQVEQQQQAVALKETAEAMKRLADELAKNTAATATNTGAAKGGPGGAPAAPGVPSGSGPIKDSGR